MNMLSSAVLIGTAQLSKIVLGLFIIKIIALYLGPDGLGKLGHWISLVAFLTIISGGGIENGIVKYISQHRAKPVSLIRFVYASTSYTLIVSLILLVIFSIFSREIARFIFLDENLYWIVISIGFLQILVAFNKFVASVANGYKNTRVFAISQILGNLFSIPIIWWLVYKYGFVGGIFAMVTSSLAMFFPSFYYYKKSVFWKIKFTKIRRNVDHKKLYGFSLMAIVSAVVFPTVEIYIRQMIIGISGYEQAGIWQASIKISSVYLSFFALFLAYYFVPSVSPINSVEIIRRMVRRYIAVIGGLFALGAIVFYLGRDFFITLALSDKFLVLSEFIHLQLIGDFFKIISFVMGFVFVAKAFVWLYISLEILQGLLIAFIVTCFYGADPQLARIFQGYILTNFVFLMILLAIFRFLLKSSECKEER